jgi:monovalent cation:H+ antiporter-2, CPA2 family
MHSHSALTSLLIVFAAALVVASVLVRLKQPSLVGFLLAGMAIGPYGIALVPYENVELLANVGIALLLFTIGAELSIAQLLRVRNIAIIGGTLIPLLTTLICLGLAPLFRWPASEAVVWGIVIGLPSTVVVLKLLAERGEVGSTYGNVSSGILLFQDVLAIPILVLLPLLTMGEMAAAEKATKVGEVLLRLTLFLAAIFFIGRFLIPRIFRFIAATHNKELFSLAVFCTTMGIAALTGQAGLSLALGAFLAGLLISESDFGNQATSELLPLRDTFSAVFFVSVGMLFDFQYFLEKWPVFTLGLAGIVVVKFLLVLGICFLFRLPSKVSVFVALALFQIGEFGFLVLLEGKKLGLVSDDSYQRLLGISIISIVITPYVLKLYPRVKKWFAFMNRTNWVARGVRRGASPDPNPELEKSGHVVICGYGPTGQMVAQTLQRQGFEVVIVDLNYKVIQQLKSSKQSAVYGDSSSSIVLEAAGIGHAALLIVTIPDPMAMQSLVKKVKREHPQLPVIFRVKYQSDKDRMLALGADAVVWEEFEAGKRMSQLALERMGRSDSDQT